ncbi:MAG: hypothetical protein OXC40_05725 [Proteobacteria bacterium]|nr:hypothetical protein [Pseudomonadota bacterium]
MFLSRVIMFIGLLFTSLLILGCGQESDYALNSIEKSWLVNKHVLFIEQTDDPDIFALKVCLSSDHDKQNCSHAFQTRFGEAIVFPLTQALTRMENALSVTVADEESKNHKMSDYIKQISELAQDYSSVPMIIGGGVGIGLGGAASQELLVEIKELDDFIDRVNSGQLSETKLFQLVMKDKQKKIFNKQHIVFDLLKHNSMDSVVKNAVYRKRAALKSRVILLFSAVVFSLAVSVKGVSNLINHYQSSQLSSDQELVSDDEPDHSSIKNVLLALHQWMEVKAKLKLIPPVDEYCYPVSIKQIVQVECHKWP